MKCSWFAAVIVAVLFVLALAGTPFAGVVITETSTAQGANGETFSVDKTIYVQGNKQKVERKSITTVTDLDRSIIYIINKNDRVYIEMPLHNMLSLAQPDNVQGQTILLDKTGKTRVIADQPCDEYSRIEGNKLRRVTIRLCVSADAPGAKEVLQFDRKMAARLSGGTSKRNAKDGTASLVLEKESVLRLRVPDPLHDQTYRMASLQVETRINKIQLKPLPPETFRPPTGYSKLQNQPEPTSQNL